MTKKLRIREKAHGNLRRDQVRALTCKNVVLLRACALECYFLGNDVRKANSPWMVLCVFVCVWHWIC